MPSMVMRWVKAPARSCAGVWLPLKPTATFRHLAATSRMAARSTVGIVAQHHIGIGAVETLVDEDEAHAIGNTFVDDEAGGSPERTHDDAWARNSKKKLDQRCDVLARIRRIRNEHCRPRRRRPMLSRSSCFEIKGELRLAPTTPQMRLGDRRTEAT